MAARAGRKAWITSAKLKAALKPSSSFTPSNRRRQAETITLSPDLPWGFSEWFIIGQTAIPAILYLPGTQGFRAMVRVAAFAGSLLALAYWMNTARTTESRHPSVKWLSLAMGFLGLMIFHPNTNGLIGGLAQFGLYLAILAPVFWATKFVGSAKQLHRLLWILLICNGLNSVVGILQVHDPQRWMPKEFSRVITQGMSMSMYTYKGANGQEIIRPPGLFDTPGAVCGPGMLAGFLGIALFLNEKKLWRKLLALGLSGAGISVIYLTLVRTNLIVLAGMLTLLAILQLFGKTKTRTVSVIALTIALGLAGFFFAQQFGGKSIEERVMTLSQGSATDVFYRSRGVSVEHGFKHLLPQYPFGAGLGRWGMIANYFGRNLNDETGGFFLEIQFS